jgi:YidC/Oxa1 family membrane protein insertase
MDKRSLLFLVCVSVAFFGVHTWFGMSQEKERVAHQKKTQEQQAVRDKEWAEEVAARTARHDQLPLVDFFADSKGNEQLGTAAHFGGHYLTLSWQQPLPEKIYISKEGSFESLQLSAPVSQIGLPVLYSKNKTRFTIPSIPLEAQVDLQLVPLNHDSTRVVFSQQHKGTVSIPFQYLGEQAVAFLNAGNVYLPVGTL